MIDGVSVGNVGREPAHRNGWLVGQFLDEDALRRSDLVEVKWGIHPAGQTNGHFAASRSATSLSILLRGRFRLVFRRADTPEPESVLLEARGDYACWGPGVFHDWRAEDDSEMLTVRWPSAPGEQLVMPER